MKRVILLLLLAIAVAGCYDEPPQAELKPSDAEHVEAEGTSEPTSAQIFAIGDTVTVGHWEVTLHGVKWYAYDGYWGPDYGTDWIIVDFAVKNADEARSQVVSSQRINLYDADGYAQERTYLAGTGAYGERIQPGRIYRTDIAYVIDVKDKGPWEFGFAPEIYGKTREVVFRFTADEVRGRR
ncbi:hypothetical protein ASZ90_010995 [hydrocarbon metagenome]|uniref:DUF4352 domain-containing protein n=1 Tax=hydrocarbon metagenome TaxID=938273 RepID=A0A0W8FEH1_9ZZZZ